jgi:rSAM/selenodomain-associated transferase 2
MKLSIIVPVLNEEKELSETLRNLAACAPGSEVILVDGGSSDRTREVAAGFRGMPLVWIDARRGRGNQMNAGAVRATGDVLLFLHADTHLPPGTSDHIARALADPRVLGGNFRIRFAPDTALGGFYAGCYNLRSRLHIFYGDSALFVRREVFESMGGYRSEILMEDIELVLRLRRAGRLANIRGGTVTSSTRRFPTTWVALRMLGVWTLLHLLMALGVRQERLSKLYPDVR